jgi:hypothetical protein
MVTRAFLDGSKAGRGDAEILSVAGFVSPAPFWSIIQREWRKARAKAGVPYFHMTDFMSLHGRPYKDWTPKKREAFMLAYSSSLTSMWHSASE